MGSSSSRTQRSRAFTQKYFTQHAASPLVWCQMTEQDIARFVLDVPVASYPLHRPELTVMQLFLEEARIAPENVIERFTPCLRVNIEQHGYAFDTSAQPQIFRDCLSAI